MKNLSPVQRFDLAARAQGETIIISRAQAILGFCTLFLVFGAFWADPKSGEMLWVRIFAVAGAATMFSLWLDWRFKVYTLVILIFGGIIANALLIHYPSDNTFFGWMGARIGMLIFVVWGGRYWQVATRHARANRSDWQKERDQVESWLRTLRSHSRADVIEFAAGSFQTGYWTYRVLHTGDCWVIGRYKKGTTYLQECRVRELNEVVFSKLPSGKWKIDILEKKQSLAEIDISPSLPATFEPFVREAGA